jgi:hypothetical protein
MGKREGTAAEPFAVEREYAGVRLGDARLDRRLGLLTRRLAPAPDKSLPQAMQGDAELEAAYRFLSNRQVGWREVLAPHVAQSLVRLQQAAGPGRTLVAAHDTTELHFRGEPGARTGLGVLAHGHRGFLAHVALGAVLAAPAEGGEDARARPQGVLGLVPLVRRPQGKRTQGERKRQSALRPEGRRESQRWDALVARTAAQAQQAGLTLVHVMDREADNYRLLCDLSAQGHAFVIRARFDRLLDSGARTSEALGQAPTRLVRSVQLGARKGRWTNGKRVPARASRLAQLEVRSTRLTLQATAYAQRDEDVPARLTLHAVEVFEPQPPEGEEPVRWVLLTSLPIDTPEALAHVVDCYRARWGVEELFKALKTGCALEKRQLGSLRALLNALCLLLPIAWRLLALRTLAEETPDAPASDVLDADEVAVLRHLAHARRHALAATPTCEAALWALAALGGHLKRNGPPGWQTLARGYETLTAALAGYRAARCDQS